MIADLEPYADYKDSGVSWLGKVPAHWQIVRSKRLFNPRQELARPDDVQLSATQAYGVIAQSLYEERTGYRVVKISMHLDKRRHVERDDFIISMRSFQGGLERAWSTGAIRSSYVVLKPEGQVDAAYFRYLFKSVPYIAALRATGDFIRDGQDLNYSNFCEVDLPLMPLTEQASIGRFLDLANGRLERAIRAKRKVIALLMEQKQAIIERAIARGVDSTSSLKPTSIRGLGDIPERWDVRRLRQVAGMKPSRAASASRLRKDSEVTFLPMARVGVDGCIDGSLTAKAGDVWEGFTYFRRGDVIVAKITPCFENGKGAFLDNLPTAEGFGSTEFHVIRPGPKLLGAYLRLITSSKQFLENGKNSMTGSAGQQRVPTDFVKNYPIAVPPLAQQREILEVVGREALRFDTIGNRLKREIDVLRELRTRLIADVVTGKLDVRDAASRLPEATAIDLDAEPIDEADDPELIDEEAAEA